MDDFEHFCSKSGNFCSRERDEEQSNPLFRIAMDRKERIDHYLQRLSEKNFEIYDVRRELEQQNVDEEEIKIIVRAVDDELQARLLTSSHQDSSSMFIRIGIILM